MPVVGLAAIAAGEPEHTVALFTVADGFALITTVALALALMQPVVVLVIITEYVPATEVVKLGTFPGFVAVAGTVQA